MNLKGTQSKITQWFYKNGSKAVITGGYMNTDPSYPTPPHQGVDYRARTPLELVSPIASEVIAIDTKGGTGYGYYVMLYLPSLDETIMFAHLSKVNVSAGDRLHKGQTLGFTGSTDTNAAHLHFGRAKGRTTNINKYVGKSWAWLDPELIDFNKVTNTHELIKETGYEMVLNRNVNMRTSPTTDGNNVVKTLPKGSRIAYVGYVKANGYDWKVTPDGNYVANGPIGNNQEYGALEKIKVADKPKPTIPDTTKGYTRETGYKLVLKTPVYARKNPNTDDPNGRVLVPKGTELPYYEYIHINGYDWKRILDGKYKGLVIPAGPIGDTKRWANIEKD